MLVHWSCRVCLAQQIKTWINTLHESNRGTKVGYLGSKTEDQAAAATTSRRRRRAASSEARRGAGRGGGTTDLGAGAATHAGSGGPRILG
jgi:hypothetical protein